MAKFLENLRSVAAELKLWFSQVFAARNSWIWVPGLLGIFLVYAEFHLNGFPAILEREFHENIAPWLIATVAILLIARSISCRDSLIIYLAVLSCIFLVRELDDTTTTLLNVSFEVKTKKLVSVLLLGMVIWGVCWQERLFSSINRVLRFKLALSTMLFSYLFSQVIARRAFRYILPNEKLLHIAMEEMTETISHFCFLALAICSYFICKRDQEYSPQEGGASNDVK